jgi:predicted GNAT family acetyltransferase
MRAAAPVKRQERNMDEVTITRHGDDRAGEYHAHLPGSSAIGRLTWVARGVARGVAQGQVRAAEHTLVPPAIGGRGVAARLVEAMVADARREGFRIDPVCSYVAAAFRRHPEWAELRA